MCGENNAGQHLWPAGWDKTNSQLSRENRLLHNELGIFISVPSCLPRILSEIPVSLYIINAAAVAVQATSKGLANSGGKKELLSTWEALVLLSGVSGWGAGIPRFHWHVGSFPSLHRGFDPSSLCS